MSDYESLLEKLAEIDVRPFRDHLNKGAYVVRRQLPDVLVVRAESFYRDDWETAHLVGGIVAESSG